MAQNRPRRTPDTHQASTLPRVDARPIGVFDSGAGGLTVLHECLVTMPHEDFVYLGDGARLPYGPRPLDEIRRFAGEIAGYLEAQGVKLVVAACNSATAAALPDLQRALSVPVLGVIQPEALAAVRATRNRRVGLLATEATVASGRYEALIWTLDAGVTVVPVAVPEARAADRGRRPVRRGDRRGGARGRRAAARRPRVDTVVLGCTHYPLIRPILQRVFGRDVTLVFSADETAREVAETLARKGIENDPGREGSYRFLTTGDPDAFRAMGSRFLQLPIADVEHVSVAELESVRGMRPRTRRAAARRAARARRPARLPRAAARLRALVAGEDARALHGDGRGGHSPLAARQGPRLDDGRVLAAARLDGRAHPARRLARAARRPHGRDPAADRARPARGVRLRGARRAHALARLRRAPGRRRHPLRGNHGRLRRRLPRARPDGALEGAARLGRSRLGRRRRRRRRCSTSTTPRTRRPTRT